MVDLKELKKLVKYLRQEGITEFKNGDLEFKLGSQPTKSKKVSKPIPEGHTDVSEEVNVETDGPTNEELLFWSAGGAANFPKEDN